MLKTNKEKILLIQQVEFIMYNNKKENVIKLHNPKTVLGLKELQMFNKINLKLLFKPKNPNKYL